MVGISHFITWHVAVERQCYIHFTICRRAPPPSFFICLTLSKEGTWSGVRLCMYKYICVRVCVRVWLCSSFFGNLLTIRSRNSFYFVKHPPLNFFLCDYLLLYLGYYCLLYHVECDVAFSSDGILYRYDTLIQHKNEIYLNSITSVENAFLLFYA